MVFFTRWVIVALLLVGLSACQLTTIAPINQLNTQATSTNMVKSDVVQKQPVYQYLCDKGKTVRMRFTSELKNSSVTITFNKISHKLSPVVTAYGKKYSNIRWVWSEDTENKGMLADNRHNILAQNCIKQ